MLVKLAFVMQRLKKYLKKIFVMIDKDGGTIFGFYGGGTGVMRGDIELMGGPPVPPLGKTLKSLIHSKLVKFFLAVGCPSLAYSKNINFIGSEFPESEGDGWKYRDIVRKM